MEKVSSELGSWKKQAREEKCYRFRGRLQQKQQHGDGSELAGVEELS